MIADKKDAEALFAKRHVDAGSRVLPMAELIKGAAPVMDGLQRSPEWERYCTYLQGMAEKFEARKKVAQERLGDPSVVNDEQVRKLRQDIFVADISKGAFAFCIALPAAILKGNEEAEQLISRFEKKNEAPGNAQS